MKSPLRAVALGRYHPLFVVKGFFGVVGAEFRGRVHEGSFRVFGPEFKRVFLVCVRGAGTSSVRATTFSTWAEGPQTRLVEIFMLGVEGG